MAKKGILDRLRDGIVLGDGGYLLELEKRGYVRAGPFTPEVVLEHPTALVELHREFLHAGAELLQALTFYASERDDAAECGRTLEAAGADVVGLNCLRNPTHTLPFMAQMRAAVSCYTA